MSSGRVSLAFRDLTEIPPSVLPELAKSCKILDLTSNQFSYVPLTCLPTPIGPCKIADGRAPLSVTRFRDLYPLRDLVDLEELILDDNKITSHTKFPPLQKLQNLWVNRNQITSLTFFIDKLVASCPNLIMLSMLNNEACPNYFNSGTPTQYQDYRCGRNTGFKFSARLVSTLTLDMALFRLCLRYYVIHRLTKLQALDSTPVSPTERSEAHKKYADLSSTTEAEASRRASESALLAKKRAERERKEQERSDELVKQKLEEKKNRRRKKQAAAPSTSTIPKPPPLRSNAEPMESTSELAGLTDMKSGDEPARVRVFPPAPPNAPLAHHKHPEHSEKGIHTAPTSQEGTEWDIADELEDDDDDWSDSE